MLLRSLLAATLALALAAAAADAAKPFDVRDLVTLERVSSPTLSPDGRFLAYVSDEAGNPEIYVRPFPALDGKWKISQGGALAPHWRADGRELLFLGLADRAVHSVDVDGSGADLVVGVPHVLFAPRTPFLAFAPASDHQRFLAAVFPGDVRAEPIRVILGGEEPAEAAESR